MMFNRVLCSLLLLSPRTIKISFPKGIRMIFLAQSIMTCGDNINQVPFEVGLSSTLITGNAIGICPLGSSIIVVVVVTVVVVIAFVVVIVFVTIVVVVVVVIVVGNCRPAPTVPDGQSSCSY
ncbi:hypothetical protein Tco_0292229 [Tanacetum coccineum]